MKKRKKLEADAFPIIGDRLLRLREAAEVLRLNPRTVRDYCLPARQVVVTNPIDPNSEPNTLQLVGITLVGIQVPIGRFLPAVGLNEFATTIDLRPTQNLFINVDAKFDPEAKILTWTFTSIDPVTGQPPTDPTVGFLPPGGRGTVVFSIQPKQELATGAQIQDQANVVFDANPPVPTAVWTNTIDNSPPNSAVSPLPDIETSTCFLVEWSGTDEGAGVQDFTIFVSDNSGPYTAWLTNTDATSAIYNGQPGHTYAFYSLARDLVGNMEATKTSPDATTAVDPSAGCDTANLQRGVVGSNQRM